MGLVGAGFVGPHHIDAVRRLGFVDVVAIAAIERGVRAREGGGARRAERLRQLRGADRRSGCPRRAQRDAQLPALSRRQAAIARGKHIVSDKPLAMTRAEARALRRRRRSRAGIVHAVTFNYRGNPLVQEARRRIATATSGVRIFSTASICRTGCSPTPTTPGGSSPTRAAPTSALGDVGSHWCDLAEHVSGLRIVEVLADLTTVVKRSRSRHPARGTRSSGGGEVQPTCRRGRGSGVRAAAVRQRRARRFSVGQVCAGHKNDLQLEVCGSTARSAGGRNIRTSSGSATVTRRTRCCRKIRRSSPATSGPTRVCRAATRKAGPTRLQRDARYLQRHRRGRRGRLAARRRWRRSRTAIARTASSMRCSPARGRGCLDTCGT